MASRHIESRSLVPAVAGKEVRISPVDRAIEIILECIFKPWVEVLPHM
jgi:hypothetical protein